MKSHNVLTAVQSDSMYASLELLIIRRELRRRFGVTRNDPVTFTVRVQPPVECCTNPRTTQMISMNNNKTISSIFSPPLNYLTIIM